MKQRPLVVLGVTAVAGLGTILGVRKLVAGRAYAASPAAAARGPARGTLEAEFDEAVLHVPYLPESITLDGDTDDPGWTHPPGPARTGAFVAANGASARPFSEVRAVWGDGHLYLCLYAADNDIRSRTDRPDGPLWLDDSFRVTFAQDGKPSAPPGNAQHLGDIEYIIEVSPKATVTDSIRAGGGPQDFSWSSGVHVSREIDGTVNDARDDDEEWVIEMAVPFESIGLQGERGESVGFSVVRCDTPKGEARTCAGWGEAPSRGRIVLE